MRLRIISRISIAIPILMMLIFAVPNIIFKFQDLNSVQNYIRNNQYLSKISVIVKDISIERSITYYYLNVSEKNDSKSIEQINSLRKKLDKEIEIFLNSLIKSNTLPSEYIGIFQNHISPLRTQREVVDKALSIDKTSRSAMINTEEYLSHMNNLVDKFYSIYTKIDSLIDSGSAKAGQLNFYKQKLISMIGYTYQDTNYLLSKLFLKTEWKIEDRNITYYNETTIQSLWYKILEFSNSGYYPNFSKEIEKVNNSYFVSYFDTRSIIIDRLKHSDFSFDINNIRSVLTDKILNIDSAIIAFDKEIDTIMLDKKHNILTTIYIVCILIIICSLISFFGFKFYFNKFTTPMNELVDVMMVVANGQTDIEVPYTDRLDELGRMAKCIEISKKTQKKSSVLMDKIQIENNTKVKSKESIDSLLKGYLITTNNLISTINTAASNLYNVSTTLSNSMLATNDSVQKVKGESNKTAINVDSVASAAEQLSVSIRQISDQMMRSSDAVKHVVYDVQSSIEKVNHLHESSNKIGEVVQIIQNIAQQTNLLALNATIEAARAGDAGRGFGVVANEVKTLANQTAKATDEITAQVEDIQRSTEDAVKAIHSIDQGIKEVNDITTNITNAIDQQNLATLEISKTVSVAAESVRSISNNMQSISQNSEEVQNIVSNVNSSSNGIECIVKEFEVRVKDFILDVDKASQAITDDNEA